MSAAPVIPPQLGPEGQGCPQCGEPLRSDQRYCLNCGCRRAQTRLPFLEILGPHGGARAATAADAVAAPSIEAAAAPERSPLVSLGALVALLLALGIGVLIGRGASGPEVAARAPVVNVTAAPAAGTATAPVPVVSDWPAARDGWTIQLSSLASAATAADVAQAKQAATAAGAAGVGVLRSDEFASLPAGRIVVYSGMHASKSAATKALRPLRAAYPAAKVVRVSTTAPTSGAPAGGGTPQKTGTPKKGSDLSPQEYQKRSKKLPDEVKSEGAPPPEDDKAPGGGSGEATEIG